MQSFTDLTAWQQSMMLSKEVYKLTRQFPKEELYGITSQIRRASVSILANIAEGFSRRSGADKANRYTIARGECSEVHALLLLCKELEYITSKQTTTAIDLANTTGKLLSGLIHVHMKSNFQRPTPNTQRPFR
ncbi:four helix bundle protein [Patescibacteria group bacterium]|nr:four helix bundle protein [Patescibacteria group bacterium]